MAYYPETNIMETEATIRRQGNAVGVNIPSPILRHLGFTVGQTVSLQATARSADHGETQQALHCGRTQRTMRSQRPDAIRSRGLGQYVRRRQRTMKQRKPQQGDIYLLSMNPTLGTEIQGKRPALVLSNAEGAAIINQARFLDYCVRQAKFIETTPDEVTEDALARLQAALDCE